MNKPNRRIALFAACAAALPQAALAQSGADNFPNRPVTVVIAYAPGGPVDTEFKLYAPKMTEVLGQSVVSDYKAGGTGSIGAAYVARSKPDGHTLVAFTNGLTTAAATYKKFPLDVMKELAPVSLLNRRPTVIVSYPGFGPKTFKEYLDFAKANPGKINMSNSGIGGSSHLAMAWLHNLADIKVTYVNYKGAGPQLVDLLAGRVDVGVMSVVATLPLIKTGKIRPLAILDEKRSNILPDVPTAAEAGVPGFGYANWVGVAAAAGTPPAFLNKLSEAYARVVRMPVAGAMEKQAAVMVGSTPAEFRKVMANEIETWRKVVRDNNITVEED
jgi:tripartite-type tricarboxylate transporter receptor subunit TctC